jgi:antitoxin YefM
MLPYIKCQMDSVSVNQFRENLKHFVEQVISQHTVLKVTRRNGEDFVVISAEDWEREQETLYVWQNQNLMQQIADSNSTHLQKSGYVPNDEELDEIAGV